MSTSRNGSVDLGKDNGGFENDDNDNSNNIENVTSPQVEVNEKVSESESIPSFNNLEEENNKNTTTHDIQQNEKDLTINNTTNEDLIDQNEGDKNETVDNKENEDIKSSPVPIGEYSGGIDNKTFVPDSPPPYIQDKSNNKKSSSTSTTPKAGDITNVLQPNGDGGYEKQHHNGIFYDPKFTSKALDPEAPDDVPERGQWSNQMEFLLSCIAMSVGLGNVWRFPFTAKDNGGGAFLIPYLIVLIFVGRPIYFLELCLGQFCSLSQVKVWRINPFFKGVGYGSMIATVLVMSYYCSIMALTVFYFVISFQSTLPWDRCNDRWANNCSDLGNKTLSEYYFINEVLKEKDNIDDGIGAPEWRMTLCLLFSWAVIYFSLIRGVKSSGKVAYFTALFPYVVLITLLIRGVLLDGAWIGIEKFLKPEWKKLYEPKVWYAAVSQCFYSLNTGFGSVIMFSSYNPFNHNIYRDAMILSFMDTFTSLLAGITIFSVLGNLEYEYGIPIDEMEGGNGLAFIYYPHALSKFPAAPVFAVLFFLMLFTLGIGSATADAGAVISIFSDQFPNIKRWYITTGLCSSAFLVGLIYVTPGGQFILNMVDFYGASFVIFTTSVLEVMGVVWFYGLNNFITDIEFMLKIRIGIYWKFCWGIVIPVGLTAILIYFFAWDYAPLTYSNRGYPTIAIVFGWLMAATALAAVPIFAFIAVRKSNGNTLWERIKNATKPHKKWGPRNPKIRAEWIEFKQSRGY